MNEERSINELELIRQKNKENFRYLLKNIPKSFRDPVEARRAQSYLKRQTLQLVHRAIEVKRK